MTLPLNTFRRVLIGVAICLGVSAVSADKITTKIMVESVATENIDHEQPCYVIYPEGEALQPLLDSNSNKMLEDALQKKGYHFVPNPDDARVFIKVDYALLEPFEAKVLLTSKGSYDYSNSASTRNFAATLPGGRYAKLGDPSRMRNTNQAEFVLGPDGKPIDIGTQKDHQAEYVEGEQTLTTLVLHPIIFQATAWRFDENDPSMTPIEIWKTTSSLENVREEPVETQLHDLVQAASKQLGKKLKDPKILKRKVSKK